MPEAVVTVVAVKAFKTTSGNTRFVLRASDGREYTTFREEIARAALEAEGHRARLRFHEQQRGQYRNVYLDSVEVLEDEDQPEPSREGGEPVDEVAWKTAIEAAPWLLGSEPEEAVPPDELFERLQPFKDRVAEDIRGSDEDET
jgi:hypothetical protein